MACGLQLELLEELAGRQHDLVAFRRHAADVLGRVASLHGAVLVRARPSVAAARLFLPPYTLQEYLTAVFDGGNQRARGA